MDRSEYHQLLSVITPVYNPIAELFDKCSRSVLSQTYYNLEWILADDGSNDETHLLLDQIANTDKRVHVLRLKHLGVSAARNAALDVARGAYVTFVDADDRIDQNFFENAIRLLNEENADIAMGLIEEVYPNHVDAPHGANEGKNRVLEYEELGYFCRYLVSSHLLKGREYFGVRSNPIAPRMYRKQLIDDIRFNENMVTAEDSLFGAIAAENASKIVITDSVWYYYIHHSSSTTATTTMQRSLSLCDGFRYYVEEGRKQGWSESDVGMHYCNEIRNHAILLSRSYGILAVSKALHVMIDGPLCQVVRAIDIDCYELSKQARVLYSCILHGNTFLAALLVVLREKWRNRKGANLSL